MIQLFVCKLDKNDCPSEFGLYLVSTRDVEKEGDAYHMDVGSATPCMLVTKLLMWKDSQLEEDECEGHIFNKKVKADRSNANFTLHPTPVSIAQRKETPVGISWTV